MHGEFPAAQSAIMYRIAMQKVIKQRRRCFVSGTDIAEFHIGVCVREIEIAHNDDEIFVHLIILSQVFRNLEYTYIPPLTIG